MRVRWFLFLLMMTAMTLPRVYGQVKVSAAKDSLCATAEEVKLFQLINEHRRTHNVPPLPLSRSLSYVARVHAMDLTQYRPDFGECNLHSWSANGTWTSCCYATDKDRIKCMTEKPRQLTNYKFKAWEMAYEAGEPARAVDALDLWIAIGVTNDYLLNTGKWIKPWKALGVAIYGEYAIVWFGEGDDPDPDYFECGQTGVNLARLNIEGQTSKVEAQSPAADNKRYHIITGSLNNLEKANREVSRLRGLGYSETRLMINGNHFRISIKSCDTENEAQKQLNVLNNQFPDAWVLKPAQP